MFKVNAVAEDVDEEDVLAGEDASFDSGGEAAFDSDDASLIRDG